VRSLSNEAAGVRKLYRSRENRVIAGVCGGVAEYFRLDPVLVRIVWVLAVFVKGLGLLAYVLCWIIVPEKEEQTQDRPAEGPGAPLEAPSESNTRLVLGAALIVLGCVLGIMAFVPFLSDRALWAVVLIVLGIALIAKR